VNIGLVDWYIIGGCIRLRGNVSILYIYIHIRIFFSLNCLNEVIHEIILFSLCRSLGRYRSLVRNRAASKGSIAEGYLVDEMLTFCSRYLEYAPIVHNRPQRILDEARGAVTRVKLDQRTLTQVHSDEFLQLRA
jgi:hypothetical protein